MNVLTNIETLSKLAVVNRPAWLQFKRDMHSRRDTLMKNLLSLTDYGDLRMVQGRLAELDSLMSLVAKVDNHLMEHDDGTS